MKKEQHLQKQIKILLVVFIAGLAFSGVTAFPIESELECAHAWLTSNDDEFSKWMDRVYAGMHQTNTHYPFIAYGTDWLAFAHIILAILFVGALKDPVRNIWIIQFGLVACIGIFPLALIAGYVRGIPFFWQCIDCSFGLFGGVIMALCLHKTNQLRHAFSPVAERNARG